MGGKKYKQTLADFVYILHHFTDCQFIPVDSWGRSK